jgi:hypothetical protein
MTDQSFYLGEIQTDLQYWNTAESTVQSY